MDQEKPQRFLTVEEFSIKYRISREAIMKFLHQGKLVGVKFPGHRMQWRLLDPGQKFEDYLQSLDERLAHIPLLTTQEVAALAGIQTRTVFRLIQHGKLTPAHKVRIGPSMVSMFTVANVRNYLWKRSGYGKPKGQGGFLKTIPRRTVHIERIIAWAKILTDQSLAKSQIRSLALDEMDQEINEILKLPEPARSHSLNDLWKKVDKVQYIAKMVRESQSRQNTSI